MSQSHDVHGSMEYGPGVPLDFCSVRAHGTNPGEAICSFIGELLHTGHRYWQTMGWLYSIAPIPIGVGMFKIPRKSVLALCYGARRGRQIACLLDEDLQMKISTD